MPKPPELTDKEIFREIRRLEAVRNGRRTKVQLASASALALSSWLTGKGLFDKSIEAGVANAEGMVTAAMSAGVAGTLMSTSTMLLLSAAIEAGRRQRRQMFALTVTILPFVLGISSYNGVIGNAGPPSLVYDMRFSAQAHIIYYGGSEADAAKAQSAALALGPLQSSTCFLAEAEHRDGALTGSRGKGQTYASYASACAHIAAIIETLGETVSRRDERG